jgi:hypothetical protein
METGAFLAQEVFFGFSGLTSQALSGWHLVPGAKQLDGDFWGPWFLFRLTDYFLLTDNIF